MYRELFTTIEWISTHTIIWYALLLLKCFAKIPKGSRMNNTKCPQITSDQIHVFCFFFFSFLCYPLAFFVGNDFCGAKKKKICSWTYEVGVTLITFTSHTFFFFSRFSKAIQNGRQCVNGGGEEDWQYSKSTTFMRCYFLQLFFFIKSINKREIYP